MSAPIPEPTMLPSPPITLIAKASTRTSVSMLELIAWLGATIAPPRPASPAPITKTVVYSRVTSTPVAFKRSGSATAARMFRPRFVR